jgi:hypothetical protein
MNKLIRTLTFWGLGIILGYLILGTARAELGGLAIGMVLSLML